MKNAICVLLAAGMLMTSMPALALDHSHDPADLQCARDCELMLKNCSQEVDSIQQTISKLQAAIKKNGAGQKTVAEVKVLQQKLEEAEALLHDLEKGGR